MTTQQLLFMVVACVGGSFGGLLLGAFVAKQSSFVSNLLAEAVKEVMEKMLPEVVNRAVRIAQNELRDK